ncbi:MAG: cob(I)yrinic acid a,c-diamide adenosyltransferase [Myxococcales bacterium]|nr:cob(I)yrinic acid a,c-diamide adenosyltransferase [Myxococcales bacterium]MDD9972308.1 cob(I)yrinic acid a,c-diamide adenosyltransferase [Myxococcales bacterium]
MDTSGNGEPDAGRQGEGQGSDAEHKVRMQALKRSQDKAVKQRQIRRGIVVVNDGDGKGKSTAAFGMAIRAAGHGQRVGIVQFIKGTWKTGEKAALARFPEIDHVVAGEGFTWETQDRARDIAAAAKGLAAARRMVDAARGDDPEYSLIILDEINIALRYEYLAVAEVVELLANKPEALSIVVTGRDARQEVIDAADTVTRMECVKHAYDAGIRARRGVDF